MEQVGDEFPLDANGYKIVCEIGLSVHSVVYKAICESVNAAVVAVKVVEMDKLLDTDNVDDNIINSLSHIDHPNILTPHCSFMVHRQLWIVMPFIHAGSLENLVAARFPNGLPEKFLAILLRQLLSALLCLHQLGHVHKNIKPTNIFIDSKGIVKLSDVNVFRSIRYVSNYPDCSVSYWVSPEIGQSNNEEYSFKSDVWAIGVVALELACGCLPFADSFVFRTQMLKISRRFPYRMNMFKLVSQNEAVDWKYSLSDLFKDFVRSCLVKDPSGRASTENLLAHPFIIEQEEEQERVLFSKISSINNAKDDMVGGIEEMFEKNRDRVKWLMDERRGEMSNRVCGHKMEIMWWELNENHFHLTPNKKRIEWSNKKEGTIMEEEEKGAGRIIDEDKVLSSLRESLNNVITQFDRFLKRELEMAKEIERLRAELGAERKRSFELELVMRREIQRVEAELRVEKDTKFHLALGYRSSKPQNI